MTCTECGKELTGRQKVACSARCRNQRLMKSEAYQQASERYRKSAKCKAQRLRATHIRDRECERCGAPRRRQARFCSRECAADARRKERPPRVVREKRWPACRVFLPDCAVCGKTFATPYTVSTCSPECRAIKRRGDRRDYEHRRRARKKDAYVQDVRRRDIYERDGWRCQLCGEDVDRDAVAPAPRSPSIDHIVPLAVGGTHEPRNVQLAHFICNARKSANGPASDQLRLVG